MDQHALGKQLFVYRNEHGCAAMHWGQAELRQLNALQRRTVLCLATARLTYRLDYLVKRNSS